jgi:hypothetical protein
MSHIFAPYLAMFFSRSFAGYIITTPGGNSGPICGASGGGGGGGIGSAPNTPANTR